MDIPHKELAAQTLNNVIEEFVSREGTDYGDYQLTLADKVKAVVTQLDAGKAKVVFDPETETIDIVVVD